MEAETVVLEDKGPETPESETEIKNHEGVYSLLIEKDDITWQSIIHDLVRAEKMDPWNIDITMLTRKYIETLRQLKAFDVRVSGKVILCAAILLKMKSSKLACRSAYPNPFGLAVQRQ